MMAKKDFEELLYHICNIASQEMDMDEESIVGNIDLPFQEYCDVMESVCFLKAVEKEFYITIAQDNEELIDNILDLAFYVYNYDFFLHGGSTPSIFYEDRQEIRNKMRPILVDLFGEDEVSQLSIYTQSSYQNTDSENSLTWEMVPDDWAYCFKDECPLCKGCLHWQAGQLLPDDIYETNCVNPRSSIGKECFMYVPTDEFESYEKTFRLER